MPVKGGISRLVVFVGRSLPYQSISCSPDCLEDESDITTPQPNFPEHIACSSDQTRLGQWAALSGASSVPGDEIGSRVRS
jgi:hypothetical protein